MNREPPLRALDTEGDQCLICGAYVPEGRMVCPNCEAKIDEQYQNRGGEKAMITQERWKSWALWTSIAALVVFCVKEFAGLDISSTVDNLLDVLLPVLVAFGVVNNPTSKNTL